MWGNVAATAPINLQELGPGLEMSAPKGYLILKRKRQKPLKESVSSQNAVNCVHFASQKSFPKNTVKQKEKWLSWNGSFT